MVIYIINVINVKYAININQSVFWLVELPLPGISAPYQFVQKCKLFQWYLCTKTLSLSLGIQKEVYEAVFIPVCVEKEDLKFVGSILFLSWSELQKETNPDFQINDTICKSNRS